MLDSHYAPDCWGSLAPYWFIRPKINATVWHSRSSVRCLQGSLVNPGCSAQSSPAWQAAAPSSFPSWCLGLRLKHPLISIHPSKPIIPFKTHKAPGRSSWPAPMSAFLSISPYSVDLPWVIKPFFGQHFLSPFCVLGTGISALHMILLLCSPLQETSSKKLFILVSQFLSPHALLNHLQTDLVPTSLLKLFF